MEFKKDINYSTELENAVLGICTLVAGSFGRVYGVLDKKCFYGTGNQVVFGIISEMYTTGLPIDLFTVIDHIKRVKGIHQLEGFDTL